MKIKEIKIVNQDESTEIADIGADAQNVDYNETTVKAELDKLNINNNINKNNITNLQEELNTTNSNLILQTSRIDNLTHLDEGSTTGDAELIDARIGYDGTIYENVGEAIRSQVEKIDSSASIKEQISFDVSSWKDNYYVIANAQSPYWGQFAYDTATTRTDYCEIPRSAVKLNITVQITNDRNRGLVFYDENKTPIKSYISPDSSAGTIGEIINEQYAVPNNAKFFISWISKVNKDYFEAVFDIDTPVYLLVEDEKLRAIKNEQELENKISESSKIKTYNIDKPSIPLFVGFDADFNFGGAYLPSQLNNINGEFIVSGLENETILTVESSNVTLPDTISTWFGGVISYDNIHFKTCNLRYLGNNQMEIYPALSEDISHGKVGNLIYDGGPTYQGIHLTENGYKAYMQYLYNVNPKHCEKESYIKRFVSVDTHQEKPFTYFGGQAYYFNLRKNPNTQWLNSMGSDSIELEFVPAYTPHTTKTGLSWEANVENKQGYFEAVVYTYWGKDSEAKLLLPEDQEVYVDMYLDGILTNRKIIKDTICKHICFDYKDATTARVEIYSNKWATPEDLVYGFGINEATFWINTIDYQSDRLFNKYSPISQLFDSWGVYHDGASAVELERLHNEDAGISIPYENHSKGGQTSAWGKSWFFENIWKYHHNYMITDFVINDVNSSGLPDTVTGADGKEYNNHLDRQEYCKNMHTIIDSAIASDIQPIICMSALHYNYQEWSKELVSYHAKEA